MKQFKLLLISLLFLLPSCSSPGDEPTLEITFSHVTVHTKVNLNTLEEAWIALNVELENTTGQDLKGKLRGKFEGKEFSTQVKLKAGETKEVKLTVDDAPELYVESPRLWWCNGLGEAEMYAMELTVEAAGDLSDRKQVAFGIRELHDCQGCRNPSCCVLNGVNVQLKGVSWTDGIVPDGKGVDNRTRMQYMDAMNLNAVWLGDSGKGDEGLSHLCDEYGLLPMPAQVDVDGDSLSAMQMADVDGLPDYQLTKDFFEAMRLKNYPDSIVRHGGGNILPAAAYFGAKKANIGRQLVYSRSDNAIYYVGDIVTPVELNARVAFYGIDSKILNTADFPFRVEADYVTKIFDLDSIAGNVFLSLQLMNKEEEVIADNFYCLSGANRSVPPLEVVNSLAQSELSVGNVSFFSQGDYWLIEAEVANHSQVVSLMTRFRLEDGAGDVINPVLWDDNYVSIFPGETKRVRCSFHRDRLVGEDVRLYVSGGNLEKNLSLLLHI